MAHLKDTGLQCDCFMSDMLADTYLSVKSSKEWNLFKQFVLCFVTLVCECACGCDSHEDIYYMRDLIYFLYSARILNGTVILMDNFLQDA